jgi:DNA-binding transcriptional ArsR family regulator
MRDVMLIESIEQAGALLSPLRMELLQLAAEPRSCTEFAESLGESPQKIYYHVKVLERAGAIEKVEERRVRAIPEGLYRATARSYWLSPKLVGRIGGPRHARDQLSLGYVLSLAEDLQAEVGRLAQEERDGIPSLGFSAQVHFAGPAERAAFLHEVQEAIQSIATKYGAVGPPHREADQTLDTFRLILVCYPRPEGLGAP